MMQHIETERADRQPDPQNKGEEVRPKELLGIDNRAIEMRNDIGLNVLERQRMDLLEEKIHEEMSIKPAALRKIA